MNQCVPSWGLDDSLNLAYQSLPIHVARPAAAAGAGAGAAIPVVPMSDFGVAELTWKNGHVSPHGLTKPIPKYPAVVATAAAWSKHDVDVGRSDVAETLEALVSEATRSHVLPGPWPPSLSASAAAANNAVAWLFGPTVDALVPCGRDECGDVAAGLGIRRKRARLDGLVCASQGSAAPGHRGEISSTLLTLDACYGGGGGGDDLCGFTTTTNNSTTSLSAPGDGEECKGSPDTENTSIGANDSLCHSRLSQRDGVFDEGENVMMKGEAARSSISTKRSRAAAVHNESERKRRDRINQKMRTLQKLVPNSSKSDKASMLDEVIDYVKQLQAQVKVMDQMRSMMLPMAMPPLQMSMMANMAQMAQMAQMAAGMGMVGMNMMNMSPLPPPAFPGLAPPPPMVHPQAFMPLANPQWPDGGSSSDRMQQQPGANAVPPDPFSAFQLACQAAAHHQGAQQPTGMDAYNRMLGLYQQLYQPNQPSSSKS